KLLKDGKEIDTKQYQDILMKNGWDEDDAETLADIYNKTIYGDVPLFGRNKLEQFWENNNLEEKFYNKFYDVFNNLMNTNIIENTEVKKQSMITLYQTLLSLGDHCDKNLFENRYYGQMLGSTDKNAIQYICKRNKFELPKKTNLNNLSEKIQSKKKNDNIYDKIDSLFDNTIDQNLSNNEPVNTNDTAKTNIENLQAEIKKLPKVLKILDESKLKNKIIDILSYRIAVNSIIGKGSSLEKKADSVDKGATRLDLNNCTELSRWLDNENNIPNLRKWALEGHGGRIEKEFTKHLCTLPKLPKDIPQRFMPTAKQRIEGLQKQMKAAIKENNKDLQKTLLKEMYATRLNVNAKRGGENLDKKMNIDTYGKSLKIVENGKTTMRNNQKFNMGKAIDNIVDKAFNNDRECKDILAKATRGHGGNMFFRIAEHEVKSKQHAQQGPVL
nr:hypothetical protein [Lachnospiraceae bacterium]